MSTSTTQTDATTAATTTETTNISTTMPTNTSSNSINNNSISNNNHINSNSSSNHHEQPQTKRQKIETKTKTSSIGGKATKKSSLPPPDIIDTGGGVGANEVKLLDKIGSSSSSSSGSSNSISSDSKQLCSSSLSSSAQSISTSVGSSSSSPQSTPSSSRATSLAQLLNVQNLVNIALTTTPVTATTAAAAAAAAALLNIASSSTNSSSDSSSSCSLRHLNLPEQSTDEVDRTTTLPPDLLPSTTMLSTIPGGSKMRPPSILDDSVSMNSSAQDMREFEESLTRQCLCGVSERTLRKPFQSHYSVDTNGQKRVANLSEWPTNKLMQFLSNLQLLFDIYLKQNSKGFICSRIMDVCDALIRNDHNLIDEIIVLAGYNNPYVQFLAGRVLASFLVIAKQEMDDDWLKKLVDNLFNFDRLDHVAVQKMHFSLEIIKRIVEWKDIDLHPLEDEIADTRGSTISTSGAAAAETTLPSTSGAAAAAAVTSGLETHAYLHFQQHQPTLENNYFAVHFRSEEAEIDDDDDDGDDVDHVEEHNVMAQQRNYVLHHSNNVTTSAPYSTITRDATSYNELERLHQQYSNNINSSYNSSNSSHSSTSSSSTSPSSSSSVPPASSSQQFMTGCHIVSLTDSESFETTHLKCITIKILENKWPALVKNMSALIANHLVIENAENCILTFLQLWENIISVKANLSIVETLPFYAQLDKFELLLNQNLSCTVYKQMLCLFNEALCYGSTLALQDTLPDETCLLAQQIVRHVKDFRILESLPRRQPENIVGLIGFKRRPILYADSTLQSHYAQCTTVGPLAGGDAIEMDKTILQKMVLLVLKSIAVSVKEIRSDSSDSSIDSSDYDALQEMVLIERTMRDVLRKLESFIKNTLEFHPECHFSKILIHLFDDQDDHLIEAMVCTLDVTAGITFRNNVFPDLVSMLNPVYTFLEFLHMISNSSDLLLDLLVNNETCFLLYLLRFLKYIHKNWAIFVRSCHEFGTGASISSTLDDAMSVLIRLRLQISRLVSRQLYPYEISPVLRLLENCESLYEGNELS